MNAERKRQFCPGPVEVHPEVRRAMCAPTPCHREPAFSESLQATMEHTLALAGLDPAQHAALVLTGSGTAANEALLATAVPRGGSVLVPSTGEFGERLSAISRGYHATHSLHQAWGEAMDLERIEDALLRLRPTHLAMVHHETSTGALNPVVEVGALCRRYGVDLLVDMISSFPADPLDLVEAGVRFATTCSGKAIGAYPGLGLVLGERRAFDNLPAGPSPAHYLDLRRHYSYATRHAQTPNTPAVPLFLALERALTMILAEGLGARRTRWVALAEQVRTGMTAAGITRLLDDQPQSCTLTAAHLPEGWSYEEFAAALRARGIVIYGGKGPLDDAIFQIATLGQVDAADVDMLFSTYAEIVTLRTAACALDESPS